MDAGKALGRRDEHGKFASRSKTGTCAIVENATDAHGILPMKFQPRALQPAERLHVARHQLLAHTDAKLASPFNAPSDPASAKQPLWASANHIR